MTTMSDIRARNRAAGLHFFDPDTMRFFRSKVLPTVYGGRFFLTSEQYADYAPRLYTIRRYDPEAGTVETEGEFQGYTGPETARAEIKRLLQVEREREALNARPGDTL